MSWALHVLSHQLAVAELTAGEEQPDPQPQPCIWGGTHPPIIQCTTGATPIESAPSHLKGKLFYATSLGMPTIPQLKRS